VTDTRQGGQTYHDVDVVGESLQDVQVANVASTLPEPDVGL
jgi:hypothetical protein